MTKGATTRQADILKYIADYWANHGYSPVIREIGQHFEINSNRGVTVHLDALERKGLLVRDALARSMRLTAAGLAVLGQVVEPEEQLRELRAAGLRYRALRRAYEALTQQPGKRDEWKALEPGLREAREKLFCLLPEQV